MMSFIRSKFSRACNIILVLILMLFVFKYFERKREKNSVSKIDLSLNRITYQKLEENESGSWTRELIRSVFGIHEKLNQDVTDYHFYKKLHSDNIIYEYGYFKSYDHVDIPFCRVYLKESHQVDKVIVLYSGHGSMNQLLFNEKSYQKAAATQLAKEGFYVYCMENRGMGDLKKLGSHLRIDAMNRLLGGSWYGEIITDALFFLDVCFLEHGPGTIISVGGVSTGGCLTLLVSCLDSRITGSYIQGYLGIWSKTFGTDGTHCICNNIYNILNYGDMSELLSLCYPESILIVNGQEDSFLYQDAKKAFESFKKGNIGRKKIENYELKTPEGVGHEFSVNLAKIFFKKVVGTKKEDESNSNEPKRGQFHS